jgi:hypothetical protein
MHVHHMHMVPGVCMEVCRALAPRLQVWAHLRPDARLAGVVKLAQFRVHGAHVIQLLAQQQQVHPHL